MKKIESVLNVLLGWGKARSLNTFPQILLGLLSLILSTIFTMKWVEGGASAFNPTVGALFKHPIRIDLTLLSVREEKQ